MDIYMYMWSLHSVVLPSHSQHWYHMVHQHTDLELYTLKVIICPIRTWHALLWHLNYNTIPIMSQLPIHSITVSVDFIWYSGTPLVLWLGLAYYLVVALTPGSPCNIEKLGIGPENEANLVVFQTWTVKSSSFRKWRLTDAYKTITEQSFSFTDGIDITGITTTRIWN